ncbi:MAG: nucleotidyltransferase substrate binding protein [Novosphingobium sp.]
MPVDISPLQRTIARLEAGLSRHQADPSDVQLRDGLVQQFEFTFDMAPKMVRRVLQSRTDQPEEVDRMSFSAMMRTAFEQGLMGEAWPKWLDYRELRNITSHTDDERKGAGGRRENSGIS